MDEITTPLAKEVYEVLDRYNQAGEDIGNYSYDHLDSENKRLALKVQEEEKLCTSLANDLANKVIRILELENKAQALEVELNRINNNAGIVPLYGMNTPPSDQPYYADRKKK